MWTQAADLDRRLLSVVRESAACRRLMTIPGVGAIVAASFMAAVETPENFMTSRTVGAWIGLTPRRYQSGEVDYDGHISRRGDARLRALLYEAATVLLTRVRGESRRAVAWPSRSAWASNARPSLRPARWRSSCTRCGRRARTSSRGRHVSRRLRSIPMVLLCLEGEP